MLRDGLCAVCPRDIEQSAIVSSTRPLVEVSYQCGDCYRLQTASWNTGRAFSFERECAIRYLCERCAQRDNRLLKVAVGRVQEPNPPTESLPVVGSPYLSGEAIVLIARRFGAVPQQVERWTDRVARGAYRYQPQTYERQLNAEFGWNTETCSEFLQAIYASLRPQTIEYGD